MSDESFLDDRYFVDNRVYNCPFCNRRHVHSTSFDWSDRKPCFGYIVQCDSCSKRSMHLSYTELETRQVVHRYIHQRYNVFHLDTEQTKRPLDDFFFFSVPTSFFSLDQRVPRVLRSLLTEAEGCLKGNYLTGASACARKIIYELAELNGVTERNYEQRIRSLKAKHDEVERTYFDTLLTIQQVTSAKVHENSYDGWESKHMRVILASIREILHELYVVPALRKDKRTEILNLRSELLGDTPLSPEGGTDDKGSS